MNERKTKMMIVTAAIILILGISFITNRLYSNEQNSTETTETWPSYDLDPYLEVSTSLDQVIIGEEIEIRVTRTYIMTVDPHNGPITIHCSLSIDVTNIGEDPIYNFEPVMGTLFTEEHEVVYSFWIEMITVYATDSMLNVSLIPADRTVQRYCSASESYPISDNQYQSLTQFGYVRMQFNCVNETLTITSPLTNINHAIE